MVLQMTIYSRSGEILTIIATLEQYVNKDKIDWQKLLSEE